MDSLATYLQQQHQARRMDSHGEFTLALEKARQKLQRSQLQDPAFYLLKVFQAAVASGSRRADVELKGNRVTLWFGVEDTPFTFQDLLAGLHEVLGLAPSPLRHLVVGLDASLRAQPLRVSLSWWGQDDSQVLAIHRGEAALADAPPRPRTAVSASNLYVFQVTGQRGRDTAAEEAALRERCAYAPVEVYLNRRRLRLRPGPDRDNAVLRGVSDPFWLVERVESDEDGPMALALPSLRWYARHGKGLIRQQRQPETYFLLGADRPRGEWTRCRAAYAIPVGLSGPDTVGFVRDGVLLDPLTVQAEGVGARAIIPAEGLTFDLGEFQVKDDDACRRVVAQAQEAWAEMLASVDPSLDGLESVPVLPPRDRLKQVDKTRRRKRRPLDWEQAPGCLGAFVLFATVAVMVASDRLYLFRDISPVYLSLVLVVPSTMVIGAVVGAWAGVVTGRAGLDTELVRWAAAGALITGGAVAFTLASLPAPSLDVFTAIVLGAPAVGSLAGVPLVIRVKDRSLLDTDLRAMVSQQLLDLLAHHGSVRPNRP